VVLIVHAARHQRSEACDVQHWVLQGTAAIASKRQGSFKVDLGRPSVCKQLFDVRRPCICLLAPNGARGTLYGLGFVYWKSTLASTASICLITGKAADWCPDHCRSIQATPHKGCLLAYWQLCKHEKLITCTEHMIVHEEPLPSLIPLDQDLLNIMIERHMRPDTS
jgi:hypothetical protein